MNRNLQLLTEVKHLGRGMRLFLCGLLVLSAMLSAAPLAGFGRASNVPAPTEEHEEQQLTFGCETRASLRRFADVPLQQTLKGRQQGRHAAHVRVGSSARHGHRLPNGLMAPLRC